MREIRRDEDGELCGFVDGGSPGWIARTVFGADLAVFSTEEEAIEFVIRHGLASLAERWVLTARESDHAEVVCIQEASPNGVTVAIGYYSLPGVPTKRITAAQMEAGEWTLRPAS
jgi:hypothetical protein